MTLEELTFENVHPLIGSSFRVAVPDRGDVELKITDVCKVMERVKSPRLKRQPFSIFLLGPADVLLGQGTHPLHHDEMGELTIFLVPIGKRDNGFEYEAVFT
jgi:hypothetical protein